MAAHREMDGAPGVDQILDDLAAGGIKVIWGREWDPLLAGDRDGALVNLMNDTPDGDYQTYKAEDGAFVREHFFGRDPRTRKLVESMSDKEIWNLSRGGHDYRKMYAAYKAAMSTRASRRSSSRRPSRAGPWAATSRAATPPTR